MKTLKQLLDQVNGEIGFDIPSAYIGNVDPNIVQLVAITNRSAKHIRDLGLQKLRKFATFDLSGGTVAYTTDGRIKAYDFPSDFYAYASDTTYQNGRLDNAILPTTPSIWAYLISRQGQDTLPIRCRFVNDKLLVFTPQHGQTLEFEYVSSYTIFHNPTSADVTVTPNSDAFTDDTDIWMLDDPLIEMEVKWRYKREKGVENWQSDQQDYQDYENIVRARDGGARTIGWPTNDWPYPNEPFTNLWVT